MNIRDIQNNLQKGKSLTQYNPEEIKYAQKPVGKAFYKSGLIENDQEEKIDLSPKSKLNKKKSERDKIKCDICGIKYTRSNKYGHVRTKVHKLHEKMNSKLRKILLDS